MTVSGPTFTSGSDYRCKFGSRVVRAAVAGDGNLTCTSPEQASATDLSVEVTLNGQQYSRSAVRFAYHEPETVVQLSPSSGLITGSTVVRVLGSGFRPFETTLCRFGAIAVNATWVSSSEVRCVSQAAWTSAGASDNVAELHGPRGDLDDQSYPYGGPEPLDGEEWRSPVDEC